MPALAGAFLHDLWEVRDHLAPERGVEIAIGFVMAFLAALVVVKPFRALRRAQPVSPPLPGTASWPVLVILAAMGAGWL